MTKTPNMPEGSGDRTPEKETGLTAGNDQAHTQQNTDADHFTPHSNPLEGWFALAAGVKASQKSWKRKQRGNLLIDALLVILIMVGMMLVMAGRAS